MTCDVICTGSGGNAVFLREIGVLIDCGCTWSALRPYARGIRLVLLTHRHSDHFRRQTVRKLAYERPTVRFAVSPQMARDVAEEVKTGQIDIASEGHSLAYGGICVEAVELVHDVPNVAWKVSYAGWRGIYATDTGSMDHIAAKNYDLYMVEANHTEAELAEREQQKLERGEYSYEARAAVTHMSSERINAWLADNAGSNSKVIYLHQHKSD